ncbi:hypothetical protein RIF29_30698 [Crotalaria pallida]|uniref:Uncharacterized protein n=1 Tax=Crotalaria pallida TaxID=3830 RepID=A0AAN9I1E1_CROPI
MKLGVNHKTGHNWSLVSLASENSPAPAGPFRLEWEPREGELIMRQRHGQVVWKSGKLSLRNNKRFFENIPRKSQLIYNYTLVSTKDDDYFSFTTPQIKKPTNWKLFESGQLVGSVGEDIARADQCYGYNNDGGCQKWKIPSCRHPGYVFNFLQGFPPQYGENGRRDELNTSYGIGDFQAICWNNCSCIGFMSLFNDGTGCAYFSGKSLEGVPLNNNDGIKFYTLVKKPQHGGTKKKIWISVVVATALLTICSSILYLAMNKRRHVLEEKRRKKMKTGIQDSTAFDESSGIEDFEDDLNNRHDFKVFSYASIMEATCNFSSENKLGQGGFGPVYKAWELWNKGESLKLMDPSLNDTFVFDEVKRCIHVGLLCVEHHAKDRPDMLDIISIITNKSAVVAMPRGPAFYVGRQTFERKMSSKSVEFNIDSTKEISTSTEVEAR